MTRTRHLGLVLLMVLAGCASQEASLPVVEAQSPAKVAPPPVHKWLRWLDSVATMNESQLLSALEGMAKPGNANQLFYHGLLTQQSDNYDSWVSARDIFRQLGQDQALTTAQRQLAGMLERYNQSRINWFHSRDELRGQYEALQQRVNDLQVENSLLERKIQAITDLEATISTRREE